MSRPIVMVVEDDAAVRQGLVDALHFGGYEVLECADGHEGLRAAVGRPFDLALLDVVLPGVDGLEILAEIRRARPRTPVILVTARGAETDRVHGLRVGADDYVVKPFSARELLARVEAVLRRSASRLEPARVLRLDGRRVDLVCRQIVFDDGVSRSLSEKEAAILSVLAGSRGRPVARAELLERVWGLDPIGLETRTVDMHIARLREKLDGAPGGDPSILTVRARGYMLADSVAVEGG